MDKEFLLLLKQNLIIENPLTFNDMHEPLTYDTAITEKCRIVNKTKFIVDIYQQQLISNAMIYLNTGSLITINSKITLPEGMQPGILAINPEPDENGDTYYICVDI